MIVCYGKNITCCYQLHIHTEPDSPILSEFGHNVTRTSEHKISIGFNISVRRMYLCIKVMTTIII